MTQQVRCPVCRSLMQIPDSDPPAEQTCPACGTTFKLPLRRREAEEGRSAGS